MKVEQFVMAYKIEQDKVRVMLPKKFCDCVFVWKFSEDDAQGESC